MPIYHWLIFGLWLLFAAYWLITAAGAKKNVGRSAWWRGSGLRAIIIVAAVFILRLPGLRELVWQARAYFVVTDPVMGTLGVLVTACGIGICIWARIYLGRNWGMPMSRKEDPELVTGGPYTYVRHPIYTGIMLAMLGSAMGESVFWVLPLLLFGGYFIYSARAEEKLMLEQFPREYPSYRRRTKMLLPFLF
jgi:protein-S-isoprenylcysteine O-methyltransferase Ste14